jgi:hypothetical protein
MTLDELSREELLKLVRLYAKNWLAHDGSWFLSAEETLGMETAIALDTKSWERFSPIEARRIMETFDIPADGGLNALARALRYRLYAAVNQQEPERVDEYTLRFRMLECRVQQARERKGLTPFPCKSVGLVEYTQFACTVDSRIQTSCLHAPPDSTSNGYCEWEFRIPR